MKQIWWPCVLVLLLASCTLDQRPPVVTNAQTITALTPTATPTQTPTPIPTPTATIEPTAAPTATITPTPTNAALVDVSYCRRTFGPVDGTRFRARLANVRTAATDQFDQIIFEFADRDGALHGTAACAPAASWPLDVDLGATSAPGAAYIGVQLEDWAHDDLFAASPLTATITLTTTREQQPDQVVFAANSLQSRGALLAIGLQAPRAFRVRVQDNELIVELARELPFPPPDDLLGQRAGDAPTLDQPVFFLQNNDVFRLAGGRAMPVAQTPELETALAISPDGQTLAFCRAPADADPLTVRDDVRAALWTVRVDGSDARQLADVGGCAEPAFASSGRTIAFAASNAVGGPAVSQVYTVPVVGGEASAVSSALDEWSRAAPRWLRDGRLIYRASSAGSVSVLFVREDDGSEREVTAQLLTSPTYRGVGQFIVDPATDQIALEALRTGDDGADLVLLNVDGTQIAAEQRGFWQRPLAFTADGLMYLAAACPSETVLRYTLHRRAANGTIENILAGSTAQTIGAAAAQGNTLLLTRSDDAAAGVRGPQSDPAPDADSSMWAITSDGAARAELTRADGAITDLVVARP